jgi:pyruvate formate lyase activating enzyme
VWWFGQNCIGCFHCVDSCEEGALTATADGIAIDPERCTGCQVCAQGCPSQAMKPLGVSHGVRELLAEVEKDRVWYEASGGGVTLSGGEPCNQPEFAEEFLASCRMRGLHTAVDTCGQVAPQVFARIVDHADLVLFDLKHSDDARHRELTGAGLATIHTNLREAARRARSGSLKLWIRTPLVPGASADARIIENIGRFLRDEMEGAVERWELCAFNPACDAKYRRLGLTWEFEECGLQSEEETAALLAVARTAWGQEDLVHLQGIRSGPALKK